MVDPVQDPSFSAPSNLPNNAPWWAHWIQAEARDAWKWANTYLLGMVGAIPLAYETVPEIKTLVPDSWIHYVVSLIALITFFNIIRKKGSP